MVLTPHGMGIYTRHRLRTCVIITWHKWRAAICSSSCYLYLTVTGSDPAVQVPQVTWFAVTDEDFLIVPSGKAVFTLALLPGLRCESLDIPCCFSICAETNLLLHCNNAFILNELPFLAGARCFVYIGERDTDKIAKGKVGL